MLSWSNHPWAWWLALARIHVSRLHFVPLNREDTIGDGLSFYWCLAEFCYYLAEWHGKGLCGGNQDVFSSFSARKQCWHYSQDHWGVPLQGRQQLWLCAQRLVASLLRNEWGTNTGRGDLGSRKRKERRWLSYHRQEAEVPQRAACAAFKACWLPNLGHSLLSSCVSCYMMNVSTFSALSFRVSNLQWLTAFLVCLQGEPMKTGTSPDRLCSPTWGRVAQQTGTAPPAFAGPAEVEWDPWYAGENGSGAHRVTYVWKHLRILFHRQPLN